MLFRSGTVIKTKRGGRLVVDKWDDAGAYLYFSHLYGTATVILTHDEAQAMLEALQSAIAQEVAA